MDRSPHHPGVDARESRVDYLRLSVTDRCNLRCTYCMPPQGVPERDHSEILSYEELAAVARAAVEVGISKVRITGGEPLVRRGVVDFVRMLAAVGGISDLSLTTNGVLLPRFASGLAAAGLRRVNVSIDSLDPLRFAELTRGARLEQGLAGLDTAFAAGFSPVKVNVVLLSGVEREVEDFAELTREREVHVRFIEHMPLDRRLTLEGEFIPSPRVLELLRMSYPLEAVDGVYGHGPARYFRVPGYRGTIGFIAGVSEHFCGTCNRLRLTADGRLKNCLFSGREVDVRPLVGRPAELRATIAAAIGDKSYDRCAEAQANARTMSEIGG